MGYKNKRCDCSKLMRRIYNRIGGAYMPMGAIGWICEYCKIIIMDNQDVYILKKEDSK